MNNNSFRAYTLNPKTSGSIDDWIRLIPHIKRMGFDAVHLLPVTVMGASQSPYASVNPFAVDGAYDARGSQKRALASFKRFVRALARQRVRLCCDLVLNHLAIDHPMVRKNPEWVFADADEADGIKRAGWMDGPTWRTWEDLALLNYGKDPGASLWDYMLEYALFWAEFTAQTNGFLRIDNAHSAHPGFMEFVLAQVRLKYASVQVFAELFADEHTVRMLTARCGFSYLLATQWACKFVPQLRDYIALLHHSSLPVQYFLPVNSHDSGSIAQEYGSLRSTAPRMAASALLGMGHWGLMQGTEYGIEEKLPFIGPCDSSVFFAARAAKGPHPYIALAAKLNTYIDAHAELFRGKGNIAFVQAYDDAAAAVAAGGNESKKNDALLCAVRFDPHDKRNAAIVIINLDYNSGQRCVLRESSLQDAGFFFASSAYDDVEKSAGILVERDAFTQERFVRLNVAAASFMLLFPRGDAKAPLRNALL